MVAADTGATLPARSVARCLAALAVLALTACTVYPPKDAVRSPGGLAQVERDYGIYAIDPASPTPLLKQALEEVEKTDPLRYFRGRTYRLTTDNRLPQDWLLQTPN